MPVARARSVVSVALTPVTQRRVRVVVEAEVDGEPEYRFEEPIIAVETQVVRVYSKEYAHGEPEPSPCKKTHMQLLADDWRHATRVERRLVSLTREGSIESNADFSASPPNAPLEWEEQAKKEPDPLSIFPVVFYAASDLIECNWPAAEDGTRLLPILLGFVQAAVRWQERHRHNRDVQQSGHPAAPPTDGAGKKM